MSLGSLWGAFTGDAAKKGAADTLAKNNATAQGGYDANQGFLQQGYGQATGRLDPYAKAGGQAQGAYTNLLGLNGGAAQGQARQAYQGWNPYLQNDMDASARSIARRGVASGSYNSGLNALAQNRAGMEIGTRDFQNYNDRLQQQGGMGAAASGQMAQYDMTNAQGQVNNRNQLSNSMMGNQSAYNQQYQQGNTAGLQNLLGAASTLGGVAMGLGGAPGSMKPMGNNFSKINPSSLGYMP